MAIQVMMNDEINAEGPIASSATRDTSAYLNMK